MSKKTIDLYPYLEMNVGQEIQNFRTVPVCLGPGTPKAFASFYSANYDIDAGIRMFCYPTDTFKIMVYTEKGEILWKRDLGNGVVPGTAFSTFFAFDLDQDGIDELYFVNNTDPLHPFNIERHCLERADILTGKTTGQWPWPKSDTNQSQSHLFRCHILGGYAKGEPVLVTVQGTYGLLNFQAWKPDMTYRWEKSVKKDDPGARGCHIYPVFDINDDGVDEFMYGERCIEFDTGRELFCADRDTWHGHSDMISPFRDPETGRWVFWVIRETNPSQGPRIILYNDRGEHIWDAVDSGHIHKGWVGRIGENGELIAVAESIETQTKTLQARIYTGIKEYTYDALTGKPVTLPFSISDTAPIDLDGDGLHEIVKGMSMGNSIVFDRKGKLIKEIGGRLSMCSKIVSHPGEQLLTHYPEGMVRIWADRNAEDSETALKRYANPVYHANRRFPTKESVMCILGGI